MILSSIFLFISAVAAQTPPAAARLSLEAAQEIALKENLELKAQEQKLAVDHYLKRRSYAPFMPKMGVESRYENYSSRFEALSGGTSNLFAEWNLFNGFQDHLKSQAAGIQRTQSELRLKKVEQNVKWDVEIAFFKFLKVKESLRLTEEALKRNQNQKEMAKRRRGAGLVSEADVLEFDLAESFLRGELSNLQSNLVEARLGLSALLGGGAESRGEPAGNLVHFHVKESPEAAVARIDGENADIQVSRMEVERADALARVARGGFLPKFEVRATHGNRGLKETSVTPETTYMAIARWEFFSGFDTYNALLEARADQARADADFGSKVLNAKSEVERGMIRLKGIQDRVDFEHDNRQRAQKYFQTVADEYRRGVKNSPDLRSASQQLLDVELRDIQYRFDFIEQKVLVQKAIGGEIKTVRGSSEGHGD